MRAVFPPPIPKRAPWMTDDEYLSILMNYRDFLVMHSPVEDDLPFWARLILAVGALVLVAVAFYFSFGV